MEVSIELNRRLNDYCKSRGRSLQQFEPTWWGWEAFLWVTTEDSVIKVHRNRLEFENELNSYRRLSGKNVDRLQGFQVPQLLDFDEPGWVLELTYVRPPYVLDFGRAQLGGPPSGFDPESEDWISEKRRLYGDRWPEVARLLDALRHLGIHYTDVHKGNICFEAADQASMSSPTIGCDSDE